MEPVHSNQRKTIKLLKATIKYVIVGKIIYGNQNIPALLSHNIPKFPGDPGPVEYQWKKLYLRNQQPDLMITVYNEYQTPDRLFLR